jgi:hypothetical protein
MTEIEKNRKWVQALCDRMRLPYDKETHTGTFYKAVFLKDGLYYSVHDSAFHYEIGETKETYCDSDIRNLCSNGIHITNVRYANLFGYNALSTLSSPFRWPPVIDFPSVAILQLQVDFDDIVVPVQSRCYARRKNNDTVDMPKVRASKVKVIKQLTKDEILRLVENECLEVT